MNDVPVITKNGKFQISGTIANTAVFSDLTSAIRATVTVTGSQATDVAAAIIGTITNSTTTVGTTGHQVAGLFLAVDGTTGRTQLYGVEGRVNGGTTDAGATHAYVGTLGEANYAGGTAGNIPAGLLNIGVEADVAIYDADGTTPKAAGLAIGVYIPNIIGGGTKRSVYAAADPAAFLGGIVGSTTNDSATAGNIGELITATVAAGSAVSLTTATSANVTSISLTAGDWDVSAQVDHLAGGTTSITLCQIGISATTATLPTQAGGSGIGTDPLGILRVPASVPAGTFSTSVGPVRVSLSATTTIFLVVNDTFTVSTMSAYGTIRARRMR